MADNPLLNSLVEAWGGDETILPDHQADPFPDETNSFAISEFVRLARRYMAGVVTDHEFVDGIQIILLRLREAMDAHRANYILLALDGEQLAKAQAADRAFLDFSEGLAEMVASFTEKDLPRVERGLDLCKNATIKLEAWSKEVGRIERRDLMIVCSSCGRINGALSPICSDCYEALPGMDEDYDPDLDYVHAPGIVGRFFESTMQAAAGSAPISAWALEADKLRSALLKAQATLEDIADWDLRFIELMPDIRKETDELLDTTEKALEALTEMQEYSKTQDPRQLDVGWFKLLWQWPSIHQNSYGLKLSLESLLEHLSTEELGAFEEVDGEYVDDESELDEE